MKIQESFFLAIITLFFQRSKKYAECALLFDKQETHGGLRFSNQQNNRLIKDRNIQEVKINDNDIFCRNIVYVVSDDDYNEWRCMVYNMDNKTKIESRVTYKVQGVPDALIDAEAFRTYSGSTSVLIKNGTDYLDKEKQYVIDLPPEFTLDDIDIWQNGALIEGEIIVGQLVITKNQFSRFEGTKEVLVIRVIGSEAGQEPDADANTLSRRIFGGDDDDVNLKSGYEACSAGKLSLVKATGNGIVDGVLEVNLDFSTDGVSTETLENEVLNAAKEKVGTNQEVDSKYNFVMICLPPGTTVRTAYAYVSAWTNENLSVYSNDLCTYPSYQMHEIGHNLGFRHSNEGGIPYLDLSDAMGFSSSTDHEEPKMCFNGVKSWLSGWYDDMNAKIDFKWGSDKIWHFKMVGVTDYSAATANVHIVVAEIVNENDDFIRASENYYILYNRQHGINIDVPLFQNEITITKGHTRSIENGSILNQYERDDSDHIASLAAGQTYLIADYKVNGVPLPLLIKYCEEVTTESPPYARIVVHFAGQPDQCDPSVTTQNNRLLGIFMQLFSNFKQFFSNRPFHGSMMEKGGLSGNTSVIIWVPIVACVLVFVFCVLRKRCARTIEKNNKDHSESSFSDDSVSDYSQDSVSKISIQDDL